MKIVIIGLGIQGKKRMAALEKEVVATVDLLAPSARFKSIEQVPLELYEAAFVCTPDEPKAEIVKYLLSKGKHVLVEKPLWVSDREKIEELQEIAKSNHVACYTAYNHRFEPLLEEMQKLLAQSIIGDVHLAKFFYGNGTALGVKESPWRDQGLGVVSDLGSHLLDMALFIFGKKDWVFKPLVLNNFENKAFDYALIASGGRPFDVAQARPFDTAQGKPALVLEMTLLSWKNRFAVDIYGDRGSVHMNGLCKWGPSVLKIYSRVFPSGIPEEKSQTLELSDPTWAKEYEHFKRLCRTGGSNIENDLWIHSILSELTDKAGCGFSP